MTFSIVAAVGDALGVAVASKFLAVGSVVPAVRLGVGAVATQAAANVAWKEQGLAHLAEGRTPEETVRLLVQADPGRAQRQLGVVTAGAQASYTGPECMDWAGGVVGRDESGGYAIQGNILVGERVVRDAERAWLDGAHLPLEHRLLSALLAGDRAGGDRRGRQSAAVYAMQPGAGYGHSGVLVDLRVDDHPDAVNELARLVDLGNLYFGSPTNVLPLEGALADEVRSRLRRLDREQEDLEEALSDWAGEVNLENRLSPGGIDARVLQVLREATAVEDISPWGDLERTGAEEAR
ncbi:MAG TPA: DUF1028 domain-containing protein [Segeticoccus sp.]|uniref:DUF1028 domain-containing protein n=1 Tax=Segeticoccus sp. TaxID=2706531 RepID=UPI002D7E2C2B|nr:DUF1028 domain-containing protein [Segeticoccus sp.]HET8600298.1 DUF1028 domain-containing protein [Segeticoccus sp.]